MNDHINQLVKSLFNQDSLDHCSVHEIEEYAAKHPYFGAVQLLLAKKLQTEKSERYNDQLEKTFLYFNNPLWVEHLLNDTGHAELISQQLVDTNPSVKPGITDTENNERPASHESKVTELSNGHEIKEPSVLQKPSDAEKETFQEVASQKQTLPEFKIKAFDSGSQLLFQPFYTVDYFASQGIDVKEEEKPTDKFGQQLKSFTDWLKTMKRLPALETQNNPDTKADHKVEQMASFSIKDREIVTEAMADVWEKQGNTLKAIEIYNKLSLLDPAKSAYFAAKIEALKKLN